MISHDIHVVPHQGPQHLQQRRPERYESVEFMRMLPARLQDGMMPLMQRNAYWVHPEAVLPAIVADSDVAARAQAVGEI